MGDELREQGEGNTEENQKQRKIEELKQDPFATGEDIKSFFS